MMKILALILLLMSSPIIAADMSRENAGQAVGTFLGVFSTKLMQIDNPYAMATGGLLGMFLGGEVGKSMDETRELHKIETAKCKEFVTGNNKKGIACRENGEWVVISME